MTEKLKDAEANFVMGVAHSGTTILHRLLGRHPELAWFSQFSQRSGTITERFPFPFWGTYNRLARRLFGVPWKKSRGLSEYVIPRPMEANTIWEYLLPAKEVGDVPEYSSGDITPELRDRVENVLSKELDAWNRDKMICKLPRLLESAELLAELLPSSKYIHLYRDGRAVAMSIREKFHEEGSDEIDALLKAGQFWQQRVTWMEEEMKPTIGERYLSMSLEDFQGAPRESFRDMLELLDLDLDDYPTPMPSIKSDTNQKWRERITDDELAALEEEIRPGLNRLGYEESWRHSANGDQ